MDSHVSWISSQRTGIKHTHTPLLRQINAKDPLSRQLTADKSKRDCKKKRILLPLRLRRSQPPPNIVGEGGGEVQV